MMYVIYAEASGAPVVWKKTALPYVAADALQRRGHASSLAHGNVISSQMHADGDLQNIATWFLETLGDCITFELDDGSQHTFGVGLDGRVLKKEEFS